ncbi:MAG TPA: o-succinylbenzoate--CoA ligase [candidate division Zixibacteria bacterium]|nr:o-succinylbenzoate--CoA ligase [candidate division Zixibacteria bacterium]
MSLLESPLTEAAKLSGRTPAVSVGKRTITYRELKILVAKAKAFLENSGVHQESRVAILADNSVEYVVALLALFHSGTVACPVNPRFTDQTISDYLGRIECTHLIADAKSAARQRAVPTIDPGRLISGTKTAELGNLDLNMDAAVIATSGSTSDPKTVLLTLGNLYYNALGSNQNIPLEEGDNWLLSLPLYHVGGIGIVLRSLLALTAMAIPEYQTSLSESVLADRPSHLSLVHTQLYRLMKDDSALSYLRMMKGILLGGSAFPSSLISSAFDTGLKIHTSYGLSEMASQVTTTGRSASRAELGTSGRILPHRELSISSEGEILVKGLTRFKGYLGIDGLDKPFDASGWYATGDLGRLDDDNNLLVIGRRDNQFISGGENIHPEEIEAAFYRLPGVEEVIVIPVDDPEFGQRPAAFVKQTGSVELNESELRTSLTDFLPGFKLPVVCYPWPSELAASRLKPSRRYLIDRARLLRA